MKIDLTGLARTTASSSGTSLTEKTITDAIKYVKSKKAYKAWLEEERGRIGIYNNFTCTIICSNGDGKKTKVHYIGCPFYSELPIPNEEVFK